MARRVRLITGSRGLKDMRVNEHQWNPSAGLGRYTDEPVLDNDTPTKVFADRSPFVICAVCGTRLAKRNQERHMRRIHRITDKDGKNPKTV